MNNNYFKRNTIPADAALIKHTNSDFRVLEVPIEPKGLKQRDGAFTYLWLEKSGFNTLQAEDIIASHFKLANKDIGSAGLKDENGITKQLCSVLGTLNEGQVASFNAKFPKGSGKFLNLSDIHGYGEKPIYPRHLLGNTFQVTVRNLDNNDAHLLFSDAQFGIPFSFINYYDLQRFGLPDGPLVNHIIGRYLVESDFDMALELLAQTNGLDIVKDIRAEIQLRNISQKLLRFMVDAFNSAKWNQAVSDHVKTSSSTTGKEFPFSSEFVLWLPNNVETAKISPVLSTSSFFWVNPNEIMVKKKTRSTLFTTNVFAEKPVEDEYHQGRAAVTIYFLLPSGGYATMLIRQFLWRHGIDLR